MAAFNSKKDLQDRIGKLQVLQGPEWQTPPPSKALSLLRRLANDPGIIGIMKRHDWRIGILEEMPPEGFVGISPVCVLGLNTGKGMKVSLRLRTDDREGFRNYHTIRATLLHELAHNDISEHDQSFWTLVSKLNKEVVELDWTKSSGHTTGRGRRQVRSDLLSASERGYDSSSDDEPLLDDPDPEGYLLGGKTAGQSRLLQLTPTYAPKSSPTSTKTSPQPKPTPSAAPITPVTPTTSNNPQVPANHPEEASSNPKTYWKCPDCSYRNELIARNCLACNGLAPLLRNLSVEPNAEASEEVGMDVTDIHDPVVERSNRMGKLLTTLVQSTDVNSAKIALETLRIIVSNILLLPNEEKYRSVYPSNKNFFNRVARHLAALDFLREVGFVDEPSMDRMVFKRNDQVLLWMAKSFVESKLESFASSLTTEDPLVPTPVSL